MNIEDWALEVSRAYESIGLPFQPDKKSSLLAELSERSAEAQREVVAEAQDAMIRYFFKKASSGETFGPLSRIKDRFGKSLEDNYGMSSGPFMNMAKTYWTLKLEVGDLFPKHHSLCLSQMLLDLETSLAGLFFPTPGPSAIPTSKRREAQRQILQEYAPEIDIDVFLGNNPILGTSLQDNQSFMRAYQGRPLLNAIVFILWLSVIISPLGAMYFLVRGHLGSAGTASVWAVGSFVLWYAIHNWALGHPKASQKTG